MHSKEPWRLHIEPGQKYTPTLTGADHYGTDYVAVVSAVESSTLDSLEDCGEDVDGVVCDNADYYSRSITLENARRIVAAVNACAGVPIEILEAGKMVPPDISYRDLKQQRDELLAALKLAKEWLEGWASAEHELSIINAAIAKAEGKQ